MSWWTSPRNFHQVTMVNSLCQTLKGTQFKQYVQMRKADWMIYQFLTKFANKTAAICQSRINFASKIAVTMMVAFFLAHEYMGQRFNKSFPVWVSLPPPPPPHKWRSAYTTIPFFRPGSVRVGSASWLWMSIPWWIAHELISLNGSHPLLGQHSLPTLTSLGQRCLQV